MLVVKVEIWPGGWEEDKLEVGRLEVANISDCAPESSYAIEMTDGHGLASGMRTVKFQVDGHLRRDGFWTLIHTALAQAIDDGLVPSSGDR